MQYKTIYIDVPPRTTGEEATWVNVKTLENVTKKEAVQWIRENIGHCDDDGKISLLTFGETSEESDS